jgi:predicted Zn finger-like uncharacterized protein
MTVSCPECRSVFRVDPGKVPATGVRARCSVCGGVIAIAGGTLPISVTPSSQGAVSAPPARPTPSRPFSSASSLTPVASPAVAAPSMAASVPVGGSVVDTFVPSVSPEGVAHASSRGAVDGPPLAPPQPARLPTSTPRHTPAFGAAQVASRTPALGIGTTTSSATPRRSVNPFLNADPSQRARRLARALVSDLVAYHPQKREEGLREGTLRQLFREDIKKSYEEYLEQVGRETAEHSPHFQEALNEILGGGRKLF